MEDNKSNNNFFNKSDSSRDMQSEKPSSDSKISIILFVMYLLFFLILNNSLYLVLFKADWTMPNFIRYLLLVFPILFLNVGFIFFYTYPVLILSRYVKKHYNFTDNRSESNKKREIRLVIAYHIVLIVIGIVGGFATYGFLFFIFPALIITFMELYLIIAISSFLMKRSQTLNAFLKKFSIVSIVLLLIGGLALFNSSTISCRIGDYVCVAVSAAQKNNPKLCEKSSSSRDCYEFLAVANDDLSYCDFLDDFDKKLCILSFTDGSSGHRRYLQRYYSSQLEQAKISE